MPRLAHRTRLRARLGTERALRAVEHFLHIETVSGVVLLVAALIALAWVNSPFADSYHHLWHTPLVFGIGDFVFSKSLHFWINDGLMTVFFLVVGMEIRREMHEGALADLRAAALPILAATGGVLVPALIYVTLNGAPGQRAGWAVPTATDIAFAVGVLALLGRAVPANVRILLLALAIIDDIIAILIIAIFYSGGLALSGFFIALLGLFLVFLLQFLGVGSALAYIVPGAILWVGLLQTGAHPTLAGVVLGMVTPVRSIRWREAPLNAASRALGEIRTKMSRGSSSPDALASPLQKLQVARRDIIPPVTRVQMLLHPWVAYVIMPLFALANAGVSLGGLDLSRPDAQQVIAGVLLALVFGKPIGVFAFSWIAVKARVAALPPGVNWHGIVLVGLLAGIGFTMSIFIAMLAFDDPVLLGAAKLGVLAASALAATLGLAWGAIQARSTSRSAIALNNHK